MFECPCPGCHKLYLSEVEAWLCSPREEWQTRYPNRISDQISAGNSAFSEMDQKND